MPRERKPTLKRRKDGRYKCKYNGMQFYGNTPEEAFAMRDAYKRQQQTGYSVNQTVSDYALPWLERSFPRVANSTYAGLAIHLQHLIDEIGGKRISDIKPSDIKGIYSSQYTDCSNSYLKAARQLYSSLFDSAVADGVIRSNPARDRTAKPHRGTTGGHRSITPQEREWIENLCTDHRAFPVVMAMLYAGVRPQEAKSLDVDRDVDFTAETLTVRMTAHTDPDNGQKYAFTEHGKTERANRQIPLLPPLKSALTGKHGLLATSAHGKAVTKTTWRVLWNSYVSCMETAINGVDRRWYGRTREHRAIIEKGGDLPQWVDFTVTPYDLRHSFATMCRDMNPPIELHTLIHWMGHADANMILRIYDSVTDSRDTQEAERLKSAFGVQNGVQPGTDEPSGR